MTSKPEGMIETNHLMELKDNINSDLWGFVRDLYGPCYEVVSIDERTGEIEIKK